MARRSVQREISYGVEPEANSLSSSVHCAKLITKTLSHGLIVFAAISGRVNLQQNWRIVAQPEVSYRMETLLFVAKGFTLPRSVSEYSIVGEGFGLKLTGKICQVSQHGEKLSSLLA
jgi:hypothetical protein